MKPLNATYDLPRLSQQVHLRILATTDLHAHILPYDYFADRPSERFGLARIATLIKNARAEADNVLLFDNGDFLTGTPIIDPNDPDSADVVIQTLNGLGYAAAALGNHEFDNGIDHLARHQRRATFPFLCANVSGQRALPWQAYEIIDFSAKTNTGETRIVRVGVLGLTPPQVTFWDHAILPKDIQTADMIDTARVMVPKLKSLGADVVVVLAHTGLGAQRAQPMMENALRPLAEIAGIDVLIGGHTHVVYPDADCDPTANSRINGVPVVIPGFFGSHLGIVDLSLDLGSDGLWHRVADYTSVRSVQPHKSGCRSTSELAADETIVANLSERHTAALVRLRQPVGVSTAPINSYFSLVRPDRMLAFMAAAQRRYAQQTMRTLGLEPHPLLSAAAPYHAGGYSGPDAYVDMAIGPVSLRNIAELYPHPNYAALIALSGRDLRHWLNHSALVFRTLTPGVMDQDLMDPSYAPYHFDVIQGVSYEIDLTRPTPGASDQSPGRIRNLCYNGQPVSDTDKFYLATNSYRAGGGGGHFPGSPTSLIYQSMQLVRDILIADLASTQPKDSDAWATYCPAMTWTFAANPGTGAIFHSGPGALRCLNQSKARTISPLGPDPSGFYRFQLAL